MKASKTCGVCRHFHEYLGCARKGPPEAPPCERFEAYPPVIARQKRAQDCARIMVKITVYGRLFGHPTRPGFVAPGEEGMFSYTGELSGLPDAYAAWKRRTPTRTDYGVYSRSSLVVTGRHRDPEVEIKVGGNPTPLPAALALNLTPYWQPGETVNCLWSAAVALYPETFGLIEPPEGTEVVTRGAVYRLREGEWVEEPGDYWELHGDVRVTSPTPGIGWHQIDRWAVKKAAGSELGRLTPTKGLVSPYPDGIVVFWRYDLGEDA